MREQLERIQKLFENTKTRTIIIIVGGILFFGTLIIIKSLTNDEDDVGGTGSSAVVGVPSNIKNVPGGEVSEQYRNLQREENQSRAEQAKNQGGSSIPTVIGKKEIDKDLLAIFDEKKEKKPTRNLAAEAQERSRKIVEEQRRKLQEQLEKRKQEQQRRQDARERGQQQKVQTKELEERVKNMSDYSKSLFTVWNRKKEQAFVQGQLAPTDSSNFADEKNKYIVATKNAGYKLDANGNPVKNTTSSNSKNIIKAGSVLFGALRTSINSDENSPVLADIVHGKYKGAKLIGSMTKGGQDAQRVVIKFSTLSLPERDTTIAVDVVAIDPDSARTALASDVDNHYILRYGSLFASSFLEGLGQAITERGKTTTQTTDAKTGDVTTTTSNKNEKLTGKEIFMTSLGNVGQKWGEQLSDGINRQPTITVDAGTSLGLLFTSDVDISQESEEE